MENINFKNMLLNSKDYLDDITVRMAHHNTAIEGNTLTQNETATILLNNIIPKQMDEREFYEVKNYKNFIPFLMDKLEEKEELNNELIKEIQSILMQNLIYNAGRFKTSQNMVIGATFDTTEPFKVPIVLKDWCDNLYYRLNHAQNDIEKLEAILYAHIKFEKIHPFSDGNGRTGRALIFYSALEQNLSPFIILKDIKNDYILALREESVEKLLSIATKAQEYEKERVFKFYEKQTNSIDLETQDLLKKLNTKVSSLNDKVEKYAKESSQESDDFQNNNTKKLRKR